MNKDVTVLMDDEGKIQGKGYLKKKNKYDVI